MTQASMSGIKTHTNSNSDIMISETADRPEPSQIINLKVAGKF